MDTAEICPSLKGFSFGNWNPDDDDDLLGRMETPSKRKLDDYRAPELPAADEDHAFDIEAVADTNAHESDDENHFGMEDIDEAAGDIDRQCNQAEAQLNPIRILAGIGKELGVVELKDKLSAMPLEYSYFGTAAKCAWAGPLHWKFKQGLKRKCHWRVINRSRDKSL